MTRACDELYLDRVSTVDLDDGADVALLQPVRRRSASLVAGCNA
jgi:hypothetical protein